MRTPEEKAAIRAFAARFADLVVLRSRTLGPLSHGMTGVMLTIRLPSGIMGSYMQEVKL